MGHKKIVGSSGALFHLILPGSRHDSVVRDADDLLAINRVVARVLWWCGGFVHGFRYEGRNIHFALEVSRTPVWAMAHRISAAYGQEMGRRRAWKGGIFSRYVAIPVNAGLYLVDLVMWLHRAGASPRSTAAASSRVWTGEDAYLRPGSISWVTTGRVMGELGRGAAAVTAYRERKARGIDPEIVAIVSRRGMESGKGESAGADPTSPAPPASEVVERIARAVAQHLNVPYQTLYSKSRGRQSTKAKTITAVLAVRNGVSLATVASLFGRDPSTLSEEAARYREKEPHLFEEAQTALGSLLDAEREAPTEARSLQSLGSAIDGAKRERSRRQS